MRAYSFGMEHNFGDLWTAFAFSRLFGVSLEPVEPKDAELFGVGSIAADIPAGFTGNVLGSGFMHTEQSGDFRTAVVWGLRGRLTRERVECYGTPVLGDPALITGMFAPRRTKRFKLGVIPHYIDKDNEQVAEWGQRPGVTVIDIQSGVTRVLRRVSECEQVVSSALHGCVVADALGVPNQWVQLSDKVAGNGFKFRDYYTVFGLEPEPAIKIGYVTHWHRPQLMTVKRQLWEMFRWFAAHYRLEIWHA